MAGEQNSAHRELPRLFNPSPSHPPRVRVNFSRLMHFLRRMLLVIPLMLVISLMAFVLVRLAPGGPFDKERRPASPEIERQLQAKYHLDRARVETIPALPPRPRPGRFRRLAQVPQPQRQRYYAPGAAGLVMSGPAGLRVHAGRRLAVGLLERRASGRLARIFPAASPQCSWCAFPGL